MKRVTVPAPQKVVGVRDGKTILVDYGLCELEKGTEGYVDGVWGFLDRQVWTSNYWRTGSNDLLVIVIRIANAFKGKKPDEKVDIADRDHEKLVECAMLHEVKNLDPSVALPILNILTAITGSEDVKEEGG